MAEIHYDVNQLAPDPARPPLQITVGMGDEGNLVVDAVIGAVHGDPMFYCLPVLDVLTRFLAESSCETAQAVGYTIEHMVQALIAEHSPGGSHNSPESVH